VRKIIYISILAFFSLSSTVYPMISEDYRIRIGDELEIFVWQNADITRRATVQFDGSISLPLIGNIIAEGKTPKDLEEEITKSLSKYVREPRVSVIVVNIAAEIVYIIGEVRHPGSYKWYKGMRLMELVSISGGYTSDAVLSKAEVLRYNGNSIVSYKIDLREIIDRREEDFVLQQQDIVYIPPSTLSQWNRMISQISPTIGLVTSLCIMLLYIYAMARLGR
jgi:polysaccharide export outer membrane protein